MAANTTPCQVNSATTIADPGSNTDGFGVVTKRNIYIVAATANFTANGVACVPGNVNFSNNPFLVTGAVSGATVGTIWYYIQ
ncbi:hypothetical protein CMI47_21135 [Candidatus Pacearchaeota archaeon]|jgi:hypothetical protein|nr:hypothetical protein [Candidatus Pacearchaeota archaeon]|tara:strand:+ start:627 stop:872 length:246 start_codon:yes stop_codon:yes gene_type:complete